MDYRVFPRVYFFLLLANIGFFIIGSFVATEGASITEPFTGANVTSVEQLNFYNGTDQSGTTLGNLTNPSQTGTNSTGGDETFDWFTDYIEVALVSLQILFGIATGAFIADFLSIFNFPDYFIQAIYGAIGFLAVLWVAYFITGKG